VEERRRREKVELDLRVLLERIMDLFDEERAEERERVELASTGRTEKQIGFLKRKGVGR